MPPITRNGPGVVITVTSRIQPSDRSAQRAGADPLAIARTAANSFSTDGRSAGSELLGNQANTAGVVENEVAAELSGSARGGHTRWPRSESPGIEEHSAGRKPCTGEACRTETVDSVRVPGHVRKDGPPERCVTQVLRDARQLLT